MLAPVPEEPDIETAGDQPLEPLWRKPHDDAPPVTALERLRHKLINETTKCVLVTTVLIVTLGATILCAIYCPLCLPAITVLSCLMCGWAPYYNIPLWVSLLLYIYYFVTIELKRIMTAWAAVFN
jgi:hypothetical protein